MWKFQSVSVPEEYWTLQRQKEFFDTIAMEMKLKTFDDWLKLTAEDVVQHGGEAILKLHRGSLIKGTIHPM